MFRQDGSCPALLEDPCPGFPYGAVTRCGPPFQALPVPKTKATGLFRVRSPLLTESRLMSVPPATEMFQFAGFASPSYEFRRRYPCGWVAPFGDPGITDRSHLPRAFRSVPRPSSPLSAKASTRCPYLALDHRRFPSRRNHRLRRGNAAHHRRAQGQNSIPAKAGTHTQRPRMKTLLSDTRTASLPHRVSASVTSQLSLFTLQSTPASQSELQRCSLLRQNAGGASRRNRVSPAGWSQPGLRPWWLSAQPRCACRLAKRCFAGGGGERVRTDDLLLAKQALSQLSYTPLSGTRNQASGTRNILTPGAWLLIPELVGQGGFEPPTSRLSSARSNQLSY
jgi:hypothetical protein